MKEILCFGDSNTHGYMPGLGTGIPMMCAGPACLPGCSGGISHR